MRVSRVLLQALRVTLMISSSKPVFRVERGKLVGSKPSNRWFTDRVRPARPWHASSLVEPAQTVSKITCEG